MSNFNFKRAEESIEGRKFGDPHPDHSKNFHEWLHWLSNRKFRGSVGHTTIWEYHMRPTKEVFKFELWDGEKKIGKKRLNNTPIDGIPLYVLFSWKDAKSRVCCCDLNFHQSAQSFQKHMRAYLPIAKIEEEEAAKEYENTYFKPWKS